MPHSYVLSYGFSFDVTRPPYSSPNFHYFLITPMLCCHFFLILFFITRLYYQMQECFAAHTRPEIVLNVYGDIVEGSSGVDGHHWYIYALLSLCCSLLPACSPPVLVQNNVKTQFCGLYEIPKHLQGPIFLVDCWAGPWCTKSRECSATRMVRNTNARYDFLGR